MFFPFYCKFTGFVVLLLYDDFVENCCFKEESNEINWNRKKSGRIRESSYPN